MTAVMLLSTFTNFSLLNSLSSDYFILDKRKFAIKLSTLIFLPILSCILFIFFILIFQTEALNYFKVDLIYLVLIPIAAFSGFLFELLLVLLRNFGQSFKYALYVIVKVIGELGMAFIFIFFFKNGYIGRINAFLFLTIIFGFVTIYFLVKNGFFVSKIDSTLFVPELKFSIPILINQVSVFFILSGDKYFINKIADKNILGIYSVASQLAFSLFAIAGAFVSAFYPYLFKSLAENPINNKNKNKKIILICALIFVFLSFLIILVSPLVYKYLINPRYYSGLHYVKFIILGYLFWSVQWILYGYFLFYKLKREILYVSLLNIFFIVVLNLCFDNYFGVSGVIASQIFSCFFAMSYLIYTIYFKLKIA